MTYTTLLLKIARRAKPFLPVACAVALAALPIACGGGGGGGSGGLGFGNAQVNIESALTFNQVSVPDGSCVSGGNANIFFITKVTITDTTSGAFETFSFAAPGISPGPANAQPLSHGIPPGTYSFDETWDSGTHGADQCPPNNIVLIGGANGNIVFEY